ncbi:UDP-3-O-acylglucosamine N-acyltransferase [Zoogloea oryzae]|uniref:UDP-3-O-acylglucosamine N-acyltransferase n=1 Tax=Zoogloea oryzae TaxID=310767 RepID=A0ABQ6F9T3_9RHOO|nr:UDP-3-O-(3-hydroxymyristoyl)glucosamine N-acyltransferase [Zoogloea oryzae]GLT21709.1 UDP-3-O-acylglucosamine N-acyltransferase [Zoogloea oryzae]
METSLGELVARLGGELVGDATIRVRQIASLEAARPGEIAFLSNPKLIAALASSEASAFILSPKAAGLTERARILTPDPYLYFARAAQLFNPPKRPAAGVHPSAVVASALPASVSVAPQAVIGEGCEIGEDCIIGAGCVLGDGVRLGAGSLLHAGVKIYDNCEIGARAIIHSGAVIGADGLGFARDADKHWVKIPQIGRVIIGDDVEIGANTTIDRGALDDTVIGNGVKLDNLIHVAHNCRIGDDSIMAAMAGLAGSTVVGKRVMAGGKAGFSGHLEVADDVTISADTNVTKSIDKAGVYTSMIPLQAHADWVRNFSHLRRLDAMAERLRELEKKLGAKES